MTQGHNLNKICLGPLADGTYQISRLYALVSDKKIVSCFPYINLCKIRVICGPMGLILNKLGRSQLGDASNQLSRLQALWFQTRRLFHVFPIKAYVKYVPPGRGHFWLKGHNLNKIEIGPLVATYQISRLSDKKILMLSLDKPM